MEKLLSTIKGLVSQTASPELLSNNANKASERIPVLRDMIAGEVAKHVALTELLPPAVAKAHISGDIHYHDLDYAPLFPMFNCMIIDLKGMLTQGFNMGAAEIETPKSINTATAITAQIIAQVASHIYGGNTINNIDMILAPYVRKTYDKHMSRGLKFLSGHQRKATVYALEMTEKDTYDAFQALEYEINTLHTANGQTPFCTFGFGLGTTWEESLIQKAILNVRLAGLGKNKRTAVFPKLVFTIREGVNRQPSDVNYDVKQLALKCASERMYPDILNYDRLVEITGGHKNPMGCVDGGEVITYRYNEITEVTSFEKFWDVFSMKFEVKTHGISEYIEVPKLEIMDNGMFTGVTRIIKNPDQGDWMELEFSGGRSLIATANHPLPIKGKGRISISDMVIGDRVEKIKNLPTDAPSKPQKLWDNLKYAKLRTVKVLGVTGRPSYDVETESDMFDVSGIRSHNCRSFLNEIESGEHDGRNNLGVVSINLPRIAISSCSKLEFFATLDGVLSVAYSALLNRVDALRDVKAEVAPILYVEGACGVRLEPQDSVFQIFEGGRASISLGYIGINEMANAMFPEDTDHVYDSVKKKLFCREVLQYLSATTKRWKVESGFAFSLYSTPSESLCDRFCRLDHELFGEIEGVTDRGFYTNSFHLDVAKKVTPTEKIDFETEYPEFASGGFISYVEFPNMRNNLSGLEHVWDYAYSRVPYFGTNTPVDSCACCGFRGEARATAAGYECPVCENRDSRSLSVTRRVCGYLGEANARPFISGKQKEVMLRVKHKGD